MYLHNSVVLQNFHILMNFDFDSGVRDLHDNF